MSTSYQNEIPPARVNIRLSIEGGNEPKRVELPLKILILGAFRTRPEPMRLAEREKFSVQKENLDAVMRSLDLDLRYTVPNQINSSADSLPIRLHFTGMKSFEPEAVVNQIPALGSLFAARNLLRDLGSNLMDNRVFRKDLETLLRDPELRKALHEDVKNRVQFSSEESQ